MKLTVNGMSRWGYLGPTISQLVSATVMHHLRVVEKKPCVEGKINSITKESIID